MNTQLASITTFNESIGFDPTKSFLFKAAMILERVIATVKLKTLIEVTRLVMLGFYDDLQSFIASVERAEDQCRSEAEYKAIWIVKMTAADKAAKLVQRFEALSRVPYKGRSLSDYLLGIERLDELKLFVNATQVGSQGEQILAQARSDFLASFAKHKLSRNERLLFWKSIRSCSKQRLKQTTLNLCINHKTIDSPTGRHLRCRRLVMDCCGQFPQPSGYTQECSLRTRTG